MEWGRILNRLIILFLLVNIGLGFGNYNKSILAYKIPEKRLQTITTLLKDKGVWIETPLPKDFFPVPSVFVLPFQVTPTFREKLVKAILGTEDIQITKEESKKAYGETRRVYAKEGKSIIFDKNSISYEDKNIIPTNTNVPENKVKKMGEKFFKNIDFGNTLKHPVMEYTPTAYGGRMIYYESYQGRPIFDSFLELHIGESGVFKASLELMRITPKPNIRREIYSIDKVLFGIDQELKALDQKLTTPIHITHIVLGHKLVTTEGIHLFEEETIPVYKLEIEGQQETIFVNAYTGLLEKE